MEFLIARLAEIESRKGITNDQGQIVGADVKFNFLEDRELIVDGENQGTTNQTVFESASFAALARKATRPFLIINATNLYQGARFEFTDPQFRYLGSDIGSYPLARAVAASSAFPFLLSPISLVNYAKPPGYEISEKDQNALEDYWNNKRSYYTVYNNYLYAEPDGHTNSSNPTLTFEPGTSEPINGKFPNPCPISSDNRRKAPPRWECILPWGSTAGCS